MSATNTTATAIYTALTADATLTALVGGTAVYDAPAPETAPATHITFQLFTGTPAYTLSQKAWEDRIWQIKGITQGPSKQLGGSIADRIDAVLTDQTLTVAGTAALYVRRESDVAYPETDRGVTYQHIGGLYRIWTA